MEEPRIRLRYGRKEDLPAVVEMIKELAVYERAPREVTVTLEDLETDGFGEHPIYEVILAEYDGMIAGMAFYFYAYSTWKGKCIYLEDIIVRESLRGIGIGKYLFDAVVMKCKEVNAKRLMWQVLDWNEPAINFYHKYDAVLDPEWVNGKLTAEQIMDFVPSVKLTLES
jgi:GNAT superfamily N-acetyltransferase